MSSRHVGPGNAAGEDDPVRDADARARLRAAGGSRHWCAGHGGPGHRPRRSSASGSRVRAAMTVATPFRSTRRPRVSSRAGRFARAAGPSGVNDARVHAARHDGNLPRRDAEPGQLAGFVAAGGDRPDRRPGRCVARVRRGLPGSGPRRPGGGPSPPPGRERSARAEWAGRRRRSGRPGPTSRNGRGAMSGGSCCHSRASRPPNSGMCGSSSSLGSGAIGPAGKRRTVTPGLSFADCAAPQGPRPGVHGHAMTALRKSRGQRANVHVLATRVGLTQYSRRIGVLGHHGDSHAHTSCSTWSHSRRNRSRLYRAHAASRAASPAARAASGSRAKRLTAVCRSVTSVEIAPAAGGTARGASVAASTTTGMARYMASIRDSPSDVQRNGCT